MPQSVGELLDLLELEEIEVGLYRGKQPKTALQRVFGGQVLAQALMASSDTVPADRRLHSMHAYFIRPGRTDVPIVFGVENLRDGGSFSSRRVVARQGGSVIFFAASSFHRPEDGFEHQDAMPSDVPAPEECPILSDVMSSVTGRPRSLWESEWGALEVRYIGDSRRGGTLTDPEHPARSRVWIRTAGDIPDDPRLHQSALAYGSDLTLLSASTTPHEVFLGFNVQGASLDHVMWFHRPFRADRWLLYDQVSPSASSALGLSTGRLFQDGQLVCTVAQEGLIRPLRRG
ncbi:acyl-CoA thioesterase II [Microlunatus phosphovorus NM-1]|uniref:Acyl-CoA thioesterase 2 n=1 Tax=Microlunatus phosphovorus (strain ATCC 700054 / DSM 10555 / JCM 9379 / NBRC 101784 / NCIMB 13414 / VKM Ac-1990 / NM-1) TaxID=1032480 RepID=F5XEI5_MICPN|nr:acyl-CoA thioesterase II [Microlunatus phosphovorus]BAK35201.1 acyl-CoA thioesterase II [Microlunatus phosphovorus NM-1]